MTPAEANLLHKSRLGLEIFPDDVVLTITHIDEMRGYMAGLEEFRRLNGPAIVAIKRRCEEMGWVL
jgi:hypothetical protein